jgi:hypothetical protein
VTWGPEDDKTDWYEQCMISRAARLREGVEYAKAIRELERENMCLRAEIDEMLGNFTLVREAMYGISKAKGPG